MKFLKALATPFIKLWNWIKQTAWVQPLLIVGCIFGVIFSIPYIASGIKNISKKEEDTMKFYKDNSISAKGAFKAESDLDKFLESYTEAQIAWSDKAKDQSALETFKKDYGEKFFFTFVGKECDTCEQFSEGFKYLKDNANDFALKGDFKLHSFIVDEEIADDEKDEYKEQSPYKFIFNNNVKAFEIIYESGLHGEYYTSNLTSEKETYDSKITSILTSDSVIEVPLVLLIDLTEANTSKYITSQVFYSISGDSQIDKAKYLANAWNYEGKVFSKASK